MKSEQVALFQRSAKDIMEYLQKTGWFIDEPSEECKDFVAFIQTPTEELCVQFDVDTTTLMMLEVSPCLDEVVEYSARKEFKIPFPCTREVFAAFLVCNSSYRI